MNTTVDKVFHLNNRYIFYDLKKPQKALKKGLPPQENITPNSRVK